MLQTHFNGFSCGMAQEFISGQQQWFPNPSEFWVKSSQIRTHFSRSTARDRNPWPSEMKKTGSLPNLLHRVSDRRIGFSLSLDVGNFRNRRCVPACLACELVEHRFRLLLRSSKRVPEWTLPFSTQLQVKQLRNFIFERSSHGLPESWWTFLANVGATRFTFWAFGRF